MKVVDSEKEREPVDEEEHILYMSGRTGLPLLCFKWMLHY